MSDQIQFELASPQRMAASKPVVMAIVPGSRGRFGVLSGHAPVATELQAGLVELYADDSATVTDRFFVTGGFCEVTGQRCSVLADKVLRLEELNRSDIEAEIAALLEQADAAETEEARESLADQIEVARAKLFAAA